MLWSKELGTCCWSCLELSTALASKACDFGRLWTSPSSGWPNNFWSLLMRRMGFTNVDFRSDQQPFWGYFKNQRPPETSNNKKISLEFKLGFNKRSLVVPFPYTPIRRSPHGVPNGVMASRRSLGGQARAISNPSNWRACTNFSVPSLIRHLSHSQPHSNESESSPESELASWTRDASTGTICNICGSDIRNEAGCAVQAPGPIAQLVWAV